MLSISEILCLISIIGTFQFILFSKKFLASICCIFFCLYVLVATLPFLRWEIISLSTFSYSKALMHTGFFSIAFCLSILNFKEIPKINIFYKKLPSNIKFLRPLSKNNMDFIMVVSLFIASLLFLASYEFNLYKYFAAIGMERIERLGTTAAQQYPYSTPLLLCIYCLSYRKSSIIEIARDLKWKICFLISSLLTFTYLIEGDRTAILKVIVVIILASGYKSKGSIRKFLMKGLLSKKLIKNSIYIAMLIFSFVYIGYTRNEQFSLYRFILVLTTTGISFVMEFASVNLTVPAFFELSDQNLLSSQDYLSSIGVLFSFLPVKLYEFIFQNPKPVYTSKIIGDLINNFRGLSSEDGQGYGISVVTDGLLMYGQFGAAIIGVIYARIILFVNNSLDLTEQASIIHIINTLFASQLIFFMRCGMFNIVIYFVHSLVLVVTLAIMSKSNLKTI